MHEKILVALDDGSEQARWLATAAIPLALRTGAEAVALRPPLFVESVDEGERAVREALARLRRAGYRAHARPTREMTGSVARAIADEARACSADLIIVGSGRRAGLGGLLLGSTARRLPHCTDRPVLTAAPAPAAETVR